MYCSYTIELSFEIVCYPFIYIVLYFKIYFSLIYFQKKKKKESKYKSSREICILIFNRFSIQMYRNDIK